MHFYFLHISTIAIDLVPEQTAGGEAKINCYQYDAIKNFNALFLRPQPSRYHIK